MQIRRKPFFVHQIRTYDDNIANTVEDGFDIQSVAAVERTGYQLRMFRMIRSRIESELNNTKASIVQLKKVLSQVAPPTTS